MSYLEHLWSHGCHVTVFRPFGQETGVQRLTGPLKVTKKAIIISNTSKFANHSAYSIPELRGVKVQFSIFCSYPVPYYSCFVKHIHQFYSWSDACQTSPTLVLQQALATHTLSDHRQSELECWTYVQNVKPNQTCFVVMEGCINVQPWRLHFLNLQHVSTLCFMYAQDRCLGMGKNSQVSPLHASVATNMSF